MSSEYNRRSDNLPDLGTLVVKISSFYFNHTEADSNNEITGTNEHKNKGQVS